MNKKEIYISRISRSLPHWLRLICPFIFGTNYRIRTVTNFMNYKRVTMHEVSNYDATNILVKASGSRKVKRARRAEAATCS